MLGDIELDLRPVPGAQHAADDVLRRRRTVLVVGFLLAMALSPGAFWLGWSPFQQPMQRAANEVFGEYSEELILELVQDGALRPARPVEIAAWLERAQNEEIEQYRDSLTSGALVVLEPFDLPEGMYGGHSRVFLIPEGGQIPDGITESHNTVLLMESGTCLGSMSGCSYL